MTSENSSVKFYDSDFDSRYESTIFDDRNESSIFDNLNEAFIASPGKSISCILDDSFLSNSTGMLVRYDEKEDTEKLTDKKVNKLTGESDRVDLFGQGNHLKSTEEAFKNGSSFVSELGPYSLSNPGYLCTKEKIWVSTAERNPMLRLGDLYSDIESIQFSEISDVTDLSKKKEEETECIFTSTSLDEFQKPSQEYDWGKMEKRSFFEKDEESEKRETKIRVPVSLSDHVYHELSTIPEVDSLLADESIESLMNLDKCDGLFTLDSIDSKILKANDSFDIFKKANAESNFPTYVMKLIQSEHIEKLLQEPGILEESDLTLITTDSDTLSKISERSSKKGHCHSYYNIKRFDEDVSQSLISFEQHELSCMRDYIEE